jgi:hypothetical protein
MRRYLPKGMAVWGELVEMGSPPKLITKGAAIVVLELTHKRAIQGTARCAGL